MAGMEYRRLGDAGVKVSALGLGGWTTYGGSIKEDNAVREIVRGAFDAGVVHFDIADVYSKGEAEKAMGRVFRDLPRHELVIASKVFGRLSPNINDRGLSRKHIMEAAERSLKRIGTDYLDLYYCHMFDKDVPVEETVRAMDDLVHQGKVLYWGTSNWTGGQIRDACGLTERLGLYRPTVNQPEYSLLAREKFERDVAPAAKDHGIGLVTYSPLACGVLTGKYDDGVPDESRLGRIEPLRKDYLKEEWISKAREFKEVADELGCSRSRLALAWTLSREGVSSVLIGATRMEQLKENLGALEVKITPEITERLDKIFPPAVSG